jgi:HAD superfamily hydrolase (TIGR01458 family)
VLNLAGVRGLLIDVDGTLLVEDRAVPGAAEAIERLRDSGIPFRITTNTSRRPRAAVAEALRKAGVEVETREILSPAILARRRILRPGRTRAALLVPEGARLDFADVHPDEERPDWVVVGDLGPGFTWERLNAAFLWLMNGASLLALHKNRWWQPGPEGPVLDAGPFVAALEYATKTTAEVVGKPSTAFFELALGEMGLDASEVLVVGDDPETDGEGARQAGCRVAMVRTGKFETSPLDLESLQPDVVIASVAEIA